MAHGYGSVFTLRLDFFTYGEIKIMANLTSDDITLGMDLPDGLDFGFNINDEGSVLSVFDLDSGELIEVYSIH